MCQDSMVLVLMRLALYFRTFSPWTGVYASLDAACLLVHADLSSFEVAPLATHCIRRNLFRRVSALRIFIEVGNFFLFRFLLLVTSTLQLFAGLCPGFIGASFVSHFFICACFLRTCRAALLVSHGVCGDTQLFTPTSCYAKVVADGHSTLFKCVAECLTAVTP